MDLGTRLHKAAELGKIDIVNYLISQGANLDIKDGKGRTALECAKLSNHREVIEALEKGRCPLSCVYKSMQMLWLGINIEVDNYE